MKVTFPVSSMTNVPFPSIVTESFGVLSDGSTSLRLVIEAFVASSGIVKVGVPSCGTPWIFLDSWLTAIIINGFTVGVYFASFVSPFSSVACTVIPSVVPVYPGFGINVTWPVVLSILYVPCSGTSISVPSTGVLLTGSTSLYPVICTFGLEIVNSGFPVCVCPCGASDVLSTLSIVTSVTVGV